MSRPQKESSRKHSQNGRLRGRLRIKSFRLELIITVAGIVATTSVITVAIYILLSHLIPTLTSTSILTTASGLIACTAISTLISALLSKWFLRPIKELSDATAKIAKGDFKVQVQENFDVRTDLGQLQRSFNHMARELDGIEMFRNDFINNFSHEFKTPIVSVQGFARQLQAGGLTESEQKEYIDIIASESDRLAKMATNVLLLSKLENQQIVTDQTEFYLDEQIRTCVLLLEKQWTSKEIDLEINLDEVKYRFNEDMLSHVWINLFGNAFKFTPRLGKVSCTLRETPATVVVTVSDTGMGMSDDVMSHIYEKFYQGDKSHSGDGNGIGLTIVGRIMELCHGAITVNSRPGYGSTFTVYLPKANQEESISRSPRYL